MPFSSTPVWVDLAECLQFKASRAELVFPDEGARCAAGPKRSTRLVPARPGFFGPSHERSDLIGALTRTGYVGGKGNARRLSTLFSDCALLEQRGPGWVHGSTVEVDQPLARAVHFALHGFCQRSP